MILLKIKMGNVNKAIKMNSNTTTTMKWNTLNKDSINFIEN